MAASDQTYRNQKALHLVFALSSVAMLVTTVWMFWDDYNRPYKKEQRAFRTVEEELAKRTLLATAPTAERREAAVQAEKEAAHAKAVYRAVRSQADAEVKRLAADQFKAERQFADTKAEYDSLMSFYNIEVEHRGPESSFAQKYRAEMDHIRETMEAAKRKNEERQADIDKVNRKPFTVTVDGEQVQITPDDAEAALARAEDKHKKLTDEFDRFLKLAAQKEWKFGDWFRSLPVMDAFASPIKIQQYTLDELPIDYSFKYVTRYDRCATCHLGLEKASYDKAALTNLTQDPTKDAELMAHLDDAKEVVKERQNVIAEFNKNASGRDRKEPLPLKSSDLEPRRVDLSPSRINMFAAHPRLDLFVDSNSPHPAEKFGCTICHGGQGSATTFVDATHSPNDTVTEARWTKEHHWQSIHFWDFPMQPQRFVESGCVKCHHQINDLIREGSRDEAPKLVKGYNLVREMGCFGCHEFSGLKSGREVGPDLRLEPDPPLSAMSPEEKVKALSDPANPPGTMRKVGPNLARLAEKTHEDWVRQWIKAPRGFRPDTRMPHYYLQPNNDPQSPDALPDEQRKFPDAEINSIAHYLLTKSREALKLADEHAKDDEAARQADAQAVTELTAKLADAGLPDREKHDAGVKLAEAKARIAARRLAPPVAQEVQPPPAPPDDKAKAEQLERGRHLFSTRGCLACHRHDGAAKEGGQFDGKPVPPITGESYFGPDLSRLVSKLGTKAGDTASARLWLVNWILSPTSHSPRTYMPAVFHADDPALAVQEADDIAAWLLAQPSDWKGIPVETPETATLKALARVWLEKSLTRRQIKEVVEEGKGFSPEQLASRPADADEQMLSAPLDDDKLMMFLGKKAINNYGCYGCHSIPGFETAKPIGTGLNDWGKKDPDRLAFEDSIKYVHEHFDIADVRRDLTDSEKQANEGKPEDKQIKGWEGKNSYERFFLEALEHHKREGFLHLKLQQPRSYDFNRIRGWDERLRMPQFKFARTKRLANESDEEYEKRATKEEAEGREAVMTFILGLTAEAIPAKYQYTPSGDRLAEVKGRAVLDRFNCAGCHIVRPGSYDLKLAGRVEREEEKDGKTVKTQVPLKDIVLGKLEEIFGSVGVDPSEYRDPASNVWDGPRQKPTSFLRAHGVVGPDGPFTNEDVDKFGPDEKFLFYRLTEALHFTTPKGEQRNLPAGIDLLLPRDWIAGHTDQVGGTFANHLAKYLQVRDPQYYGGPNANRSFAAGPPLLTHEGEKVQPVWLFQFLLSPHKIRPLGALRMPKFNLSDDEAMALVNYFAAADKTSNPGIGLTYPYLTVPERQESYLHAKTAEYVERLKKANAYEARVKDLQPTWQRITREQIDEAEARLKTAKARLEEAKQKKEAVETAEKAVKDTDEELKKLRAALDTNDFKELKRRWEQREAYVVDAVRLISNEQLCLQCHQVGTTPAKEQQGPSLAESAERLRPEWTRRWITNPQRFLHYKTIMPLNFKADAKENAALFLGSDQSFSLDQIKACRDLLMIYPQVVDWPVIKYRPGPGATGGQ